MPSKPIQVMPSGLLGFLQLKNSGKNPNELPDTLQSVLELRDWLFETNSEVEFLSSATLIGSGQAAGNIAMITVPQGEYWAILDVDAEIVWSAAQTFVARLQYREPTGRSFGLSDYFTRNNTNQAMAMDRSLRIPILRPGSVIGFHATTVTMGGADAGGNFEVRFARLRA